MPSPLIDLKGFSSPSQFSEDPSFPGERQVGFWKSETMPDKNDLAIARDIEDIKPFC
ncbi:hypothetical protein CRG98_043264 [Punica granatum]|uniref:Uncharacterized protein n=1 Tax=Punica granatum TaxID=22663 RepID=A0A2I0HXU1_PUNGR|nr:hypothetical protein CRG98_043264 [Punica granatum]